MTFIRASEVYGDVITPMEWLQDNAPDSVLKYCDALQQESIGLDSAEAQEILTEDKNKVVEFLKSQKADDFWDIFDYIDMLESDLLTVKNNIQRAKMDARNQIYHLDIPIDKAIKIAWELS